MQTHVTLEHRMQKTARARKPMLDRHVVPAWGRGSKSLALYLPQRSSSDWHTTATAFSDFQRFSALPPVPQQKDLGACPDPASLSAGIGKYVAFLFFFFLFFCLCVLQNLKKNPADCAHQSPTVW